MKALIFSETGEPAGVLKLAEIPTPPLAPGEALVRVLLSPITPSDLHMVLPTIGPCTPGPTASTIPTPSAPGLAAQGGRLAPTDGGCIQRREVGASTGAAVSIQDNQRHPAARAGNTHTQPRRQ